MNSSASIELSNDRLMFRLGAAAGNQEDILGLHGAGSWLPDRRTIPQFAVFVDDRPFGATTPGVVRLDVETIPGDGARTTRIHFAYPSEGLEVTQHVVVYEQTSLFETWQSVRNTGPSPKRITRLDSLVLDLAANDYEILSYTSDWGDEFESVRAPLARVPVLETRRGRSSKDRHPWFALFRPDGAILSASVAWSGNWIFRFEPREDGAVRVSGGLHDWEFSHDLEPGATIESVPVAVVLGEHSDLNTVSIPYGRVGRSHWYPRGELSDRLPVEWNQWWSYEDRNIDEQVFRANVDVAAQIGIEVCTLDAGWFGPTDPASHWYDYRGDFADVNTSRFPSGIRALSDYVHSKGMAFGLWCEIEALGQHARVAEQHPDFVATREGKRLGYLCFGNPAVQDWAFAMLEHLIQVYGVDWIKLDFNLDPEAGCDRLDHGHDAGDGLYAHYQGYYRTLERLRAAHPRVVLENCSSGGLRIDLGILRRTVPTFLSDPDWPEHGLQIIWGASTMMAPNAWLHWGYSEWITEHPHQKFNPRDPELRTHQLDYYIRIGMLGAFGISQRLPDLPAPVADRYAAHIRLYRSTLRRFVREADFYRLTDQPRRWKRGERWAAFQYVLPDRTEHLLAVFRLPGGEEHRTIRLYEVDPEREYTLTWLLEDRTEQRRGSELIAAGLPCEGLPEEGSALVLLR
jgi:alpha-galactosidase